MNDEDLVIDWLGCDAQEVWQILVCLFSTGSRRYQAMGMDQIGYWLVWIKQDRKVIFILFHHYLVSFQTPFITKTDTQTHRQTGPQAEIGIIGVWMVVKIGIIGVVVIE